MNDKHRPAPGATGEREQDREQREYPHGTGDRNTHPRPDDRGDFRGGEQRGEGSEDTPGTRRGE